jgi:hypothetical protein
MPLKPLGKVKLGRRLACALSNLHAANELNKGMDPISPPLHTAIYVVEQCLQLLCEKTKRRS